MKDAPILDYHLTQTSLTTELLTEGERINNNVVGRGRAELLKLLKTNGTQVD